MTDLPVSTAPAAAARPLVQGRCPACNGSSLFLGSGGYVTCSRIDCPDPSFANDLLRGERVGADTPLICSDERHAAKVADIERQLATAREAFASATTRAARAEATLARVRALHQPTGVVAAAEHGNPPDCTTCGPNCWPCPTIRALDGEEPPRV